MRTDGGGVLAGVGVGNALASGDALGVVAAGTMLAGDFALGGGADDGAPCAVNGFLFSIFGPSGQRPVHAATKTAAAVARSRQVAGASTSRLPMGMPSRPRSWTCIRSPTKVMAGFRSGAAPSRSSSALTSESDGHGACSAAPSPSSWPAALATRLNMKPSHIGPTLQASHELGNR